MEIKKGYEVVLKSDRDELPYSVSEVSGDSVRLSYTTSAGMRVDSGWFDKDDLKVV